MVKIDLCILAKAGTEDVKKIVEKAKPYFDKILIKSSPIKDFSKAKNELQSRSDADYVLWWDTDEDYPLDFLRNLRKMLENRPSLCYRFPRKNLPDLSGYPDYQVRLIRREECYWIRPVHDIVAHISGKRADQVDCITLDQYPITHNPGNLYKRIDRFRRNMHLLINSDFPKKELLREVDDFIYEVKHRYGDQKCSKV